MRTEDSDNMMKALEGIATFARIAREDWRRNPRNRYQPYMVYSRRAPRYQPKYP